MTHILTTEEKIALARAPIGVGILASLGTRYIPGKLAAGGTEGSKSPVTGKLGNVVGWQHTPNRQH